MTPERWRRIEDLFEAAVALPAGDRVRFLDEECGSDAALRRELLEMLRHNGGGESITAIVQSAAAAALEADDARPGRHLGPYRVIRLLGRGGMGAVFLACRDDDQFHKEVAIKTLQFEAFDPAELKRFRHERQVLANLEHPHIARLLDGGASEHGLPYIVMEYVDGTPITDYCREKGLSAEARLRLFRQVCDAVQYAHQKLVIHRDIKPGNILVTGEGVPKLLDFGIAKLLDQPGETDRPLTASIPMMTPRYASPEQIRGDPVSTSTDVYSLGVVLYEIMTGESPYEIPSDSPAEIARTVCETEPKPTDIKGDLRNILLMALRKEPQRRYASVQSFADDIDRCMADLPVRARPDTIRYRAVKFLRRHRFGVAAAAIVLFSLTAGLGVAMRQTQIARRQARIADQRYAEVRQLANKVLFDFQNRLAQTPGTIEFRSVLADTGREYLERLSKTADGGDPQILWETAQAQQKLSQLLGWSASASLGRMAEAVSETQAALSIEESLLERGLLSQAQIEILVGDYIRAGTTYRIGWRDREGSVVVERGIEVAKHYVPARLPALEILLARLYGRTGRTAQAQAMLRSAADRLIGPGKELADHPEIEERAPFASTAGEVALRAGDFERSLVFRRMVVSHEQQVLIRAPGNRGIAAQFPLDSYHLLSMVAPGDLPNLGRASEGEPIAQHGLDVAAKALMRDPENQPPRAGLVVLSLWRAQSMQKDRPAEALALYRRALEEGRSFPPEYAAYPELCIPYLYTIIEPLASTGRIVEAREFFERSRAFLEPRTARDPADIFAAYHLAGAWMYWADAQSGAVEALAASRSAEGVVQATIDVAPDDFLLWWRLAQILERRQSRLGQLERAANAARSTALWQKWVDRYPDSEFHRNQLRRAKAMGAGR